jgi:hypothetical protein
LVLARIENLVDGVELLPGFERWLMSPVCRMKAGRRGQRIDLVDRGLQGTRRRRICRFVEAHVAVADLDEGKVALGGLFFELGKATQAVGAEHSAFESRKKRLFPPRFAMHFRKPRRSIPSWLWSTSRHGFSRIS